MAHEPLALVQEVYGAFGRGDVAAILELLAPDVAWDVVGRAKDYPMFGSWRGPEEVREFFEALAANEDFSEFAPRTFLPSGDTVVVLGHAALTLRKTGRPVAYDWAHVFTVKGGRIAAFKEFYDTAQVAEAYRR